MILGRPQNKMIYFCMNLLQYKIYIILDCLTIFKRGKKSSVERVILRHRPGRPGPRTSHKRGPPTFRVKRCYPFKSKHLKNPNTNILRHVACGWPRL